MRLKARMGDAQHAAVNAELVRLTLGGTPERPELTDWQRFARADLVRLQRRATWWRR